MSWLAAEARSFLPTDASLAVSRTKRLDWFLSQLPQETADRLKSILNAPRTLNCPGPHSLDDLEDGDPDKVFFTTLKFRRGVDCVSVWKSFFQMVVEISITGQYFPKTSFTPPQGCPAQAKLVVIGSHPSTVEESTSVAWMQTYYSGPLDHSVLFIDARPIKQTIPERKTRENRAERMIGAQNMAKIEHFDNSPVAPTNPRLRLALGAEQPPYEKHHIMLHNTRTSSNRWNAPFQLAIDDASIFSPLYHPPHFDYSRLTSAANVQGMQAVIRLAHDLVDHPPPPSVLATAVDITREPPGWNVVDSFLSEELGEPSSIFPWSAVPPKLRAWQRIEVNPKLWYQRAQNKKSSSDEQQPKQRGRDSVKGPQNAD